MDKRKKHIADSAEPKTIDELYMNGWNIQGAKKGPDSIVYGINVMKQQALFVTPRSANLIKEFRKYKWATDKEGKSTNKPIDAFNHSIDGARYFIMDTIPAKSIAKKFKKTKIDIGKAVSGGLRGRSF